MNLSPIHSYHALFQAHTLRVQVYATNFLDCSLYGISVLSAPHACMHAYTHTHTHTHSLSLSLRSLLYLGSHERAAALFHDVFGPGTPYTTKASCGNLVLQYNFLHCNLTPLWYLNNKVMTEYGGGIMAECIVNIYIYICVCVCMYVWI